MIRLLLLGFYLETKKFSSKKAKSIIRNNIVLMITSIIVLLISIIKANILYFFLIILIIPLTSNYWLPITSIYNFLENNYKNKIIRYRNWIVLYSNIIYFVCGFMLIFGIYEIFGKI